MIPGYWSNVYLGGVLTDLPLAPDGPLTETVCDTCLICSQVCPVEFINPRKQEEVHVTIAGRDFAYNQKRGDFRCVIGCGGFTGLSKNGQWSSWSTGRTSLPDSDEALPQLCASLRNDPANAAAKKNITFGREAFWTAQRKTSKPPATTALRFAAGR